MSKSNSFKKSRKLALGIAVAMGCSMVSVAFADQTITEPIIGPGNLPFSENVNVEVSNNLIAGGPWLPNIGAAVSASEEGTELSIDMGNNALSIIGNNDGHSTGIAAINKGKVEITSTGDLSVYAESTNENKGQTAALFVNGGGQILIHNDDNVLSLNGTTGNSTNGAVVKAMNGAKDTRSYIKIDGLVDINAKTDNGVGMSEAVSAVASTIDIGGGKIFATKKGVNPGLNYGFAENCAIRAYGEFVSSNYGIVNVNVVKDGDALDAKATGAGDKEVQIFGDFNTVGGMGTKGTINVGLNTSESYWVGDYIKGAGWGETPGDYGSVNLFMGNQARWLGNASFATNVKMSDPGTLWQGYSLNNAVSAEITNGAAWYNYNEADTTALLRLTGSSNAKNAGLVYMTPFTKTVDGKSASYNTGNVSIANYAGNMKVFYKHDAQDVTNILGGNFTIANAEKGSTINLITDNTGISNGNTTQINQVLDKLANKLYYTAYTTGERNLDGTVTIAEGLTSSSVSKKTGKISYSSTDGQGSLNPATTTAARMKVLQAFARYASSDLTTSLNDDSGLEFNTSITGDASEDTDYVTAGVIDQGNGSYNFKENVTINSEVGALVQPSSSYTTYNKFVAPIYTAVGKDITINMNNNTLNINHIAGNEYNASKLVGLAAGQGSSLEINNAGNINVTFANEKGNNHTGALAYGGGKLIIHNGGENQDQKIFSFNGLYEAKGKRGLYAETKKSDSGEESQIVIDGLVNIVAKDTSVYGGAAVSESYAVQADSAQIDIGGGKFVGRLEAKHTYNYGDMTRINVNTQKDNDGNVIGAGDNVVQIDGDLRAKGSKKAAQVNVGLNGEDSYLRGNVIGTQSSNATLDNESAYDSTTKYGVNIYMDNGADWTGGAKGALTLRMHNGATWHGGSNAEKDSDAINHMSMTLDTGAVWYHNGTHDIAVDYFTGGKDEAARGTIVMDGDKNITLSNYTGNTIVSFVRDSEYPTRVLGGNITIGSAAEGSAITLSTDNDGIDTSNAGEVSKVLRKLANKLTYTGAIEGAENNLDGYVQIAEGLTAASAAKYVGSVKYSDTTGQGSLGEKISVQTETPEGDNTDADKNFLLEKGDWHGNNSGDNVNLALKDKASWTGNNSGSNMVVNATDSAWTGDNKGAGTNVTLNASAWNGKNDGSKAVVTLKNKASWTGDSSGNDLQLTLDNSAYQGNIRGDRSSVTLNNGSSWSGNVIGSGSTLNMHGDSLWQLKGDNVLDSFNAGSVSKMRKAAAVAAGGGTTVDMTDATAGNLTINKYNGKATFVYQHDVNDVTKINGGDITIGTATTGSGITLLTDSNGLETTNKYAINDALNALANKLYYTGYLNGEKNLDGYVKIAEGLTSASATKFAGNIGYDSKTGQGSLDKATVDYGTSIPNVQSKTDFKTTVTGDYVTDKEYRDAGVLPDTDNIYNFTKDATTITTDSSAITTAKDTTLKLNNHDLTITANSGDGIATTGGTLTVQDAGNLTVSGAKAINANNSKVDITAVNATLNGDVSTNNVVNIKATKAAKINGAVSANGANAAVSINGGEATTVTGTVNADGANAAVTIDSADTIIGSDITANGKGAKVTAKNLSKLDGNVATDADGSVELNFKEGASWSGDNSGNTTMSLSKGTWNGANTGKLNATLTNGTTWTGDSSGAGSTIKLDASSWSGMNSGANADITLTNGASWSKGNTADGVTVKADKAAWTGANGGAKANITLSNSASWNGANTGSNATVNLTDSSWSGDNSGANVTITANNSKWNGSTSAAGSATLTNGSIWNGASTSADFSLTLNGSTWNNSGASSLKSFNATNGIVDMTNAAASVTIGSYSGDATVIYKHNSSNPGEVYGGNFTVNKAAANSKITMLTDNTGVDTTDEDKINEALDALAGKLFYTGAIGGAENNLNGTVKIAEGLTATSVAKQTAGIVYDKTTGQGSADHKTVTPGPVYPSEQDRTAFVTSITGEHLTDKEYRKAGVLSNTIDNNIYNFTKDATTITTAGSAVTTAKDTTLKLNSHDLTITANSGDGIATSGGTLTVQNVGSLTVSGAKAINANNSKVDITAVNATLNGDVSTNNVVNIKATKAAKVNGAVSASGANSSVSINGTASAAISGAVSADGANAAVTIDSADTIIGSDITANGKGAKVTAKNLSKLDGNVATDADGSVELNFKEGAAWSGDNAGNTTMSLSKGTWNGANTGKLNATLTNGTTWTGDSSGAGSTIKLDASSWSGMNSGANADITLTNGASWSKGNTADGVTVKADKAAWTGANGGAKANITLSNSASWNGANTGSNATVNLTDSSWSGDNSGANVTITANNSKWNGSTSAAGSATLTNGSIWNGASTSADFSLTLNGSTWNNSGASSLKSFNATNGIVDMTNAAASVTIGSYSGDATVIYKHNSSNPGEVYGGNFTVNKAAANSKITMLTDNTGVDTTDEDKINEALDALAGKLFYTGAIGGAENNLNGTVKIAEGLTATSVAKQTAGIVYDKTTGQGSADHKTVTPGPVYPSEQDRTAFVTSITGEHLTDKEYRKAGVLSNTVDNNIYNFTKDATTITTAGSAITTAKDTTLKLNSHDLTITANSGDGIATTGGKLTVQDAGNLTVKGAKAINANNSKVDITAVNATLNGDVSTNNVVNIKATKAAKVNGAVSANGANAAVTIDSTDTTIGSDITANGNGAKVTAKNLSKLNGDVATDADGSVELNFKEGASWTGDNSGNTTMSLSKGSWNGANTGKLNATLTNGTSWTGDSSGAGSTIKLDASTWNGANSGANTNITLSNATTWTGANNGANATVNLTDSSWSGDNSGANVTITANNSKWNGSTSAAGSATLTNGSIWNGASTSADFSLTLNGSTWNNSGASSLKSFNATNGIVDMTNAAASVTIGSYSGDATVIYKHNSSNPGEVYGGNFTVNKAAANSKITMLTDNTGVDTTDEDKINEALDALAGKLFYTGAIGGAENNLNGTVKIAEGLTATSVAKQTAGIVYDKTTGQGSADHKTVTPGPVYPTEQDRTAFVTSITGEHLTDKEYRKAGVLSNTVDNNIYNFTKDATTITTDSSAVTTAKDTTLKLNNNDLTITANSGDGIATTGATLTVQNAGSLTVSGAKAINANNSKVDITAVNATLNGDVSTNNVVNIKATKAAKVNGAVSASGANSSVSINGTASAAISGAVSADGANAAVTIDSADTIIGSDITANGKGAKVTAKNLSKLDGNVATDADGSVELNFKEGAAWSGDNAGNTTMSLSKGTWNGANTGKLNATLTNGTTWTGDSSGAGSTIKLDASSWSGMNSGANADITLTNGASWSKGNTADGVTVKADKAAWTGANGGAKANITLSNSASWNGANTGSNATVNLTDSSWSGDNSGANVTITANNSKWNGSTSAAGSATLTNGSIWNGASTSADFSLTLNGSTWNNSGASSLKSFNATNGIVDMTNAAASVTIGSYSGDATVIYKHNSSNPGEVYGGNFTVNKAAANSKITMLTDNTGVDTTDEDKINEALDALAGKLFYTGAIGGAENNLNGTVKIAEGLTATSVAKQTAGIVYDKTTGQGSADHKTVTPGPVYPTEQDRTAFVTSITGEHFADKEYRKAGVLSNTVDNNIYNFTKDATTITTDSSAITTAKDTTLKLNSHDMTITANSGDGIATTGATLTVQDAGSLTVSGAKAINANNSKVEITAVNATLNGDVSTNNVVNIKATKAVKVNGAVSASGANSSVSINGTASAAISGAVSADGANAAVTIDSADTIIGSDITANGKGAKVTAKNLSKLDGNVATDADGSVELNFKEGAAWSGDNAGNTTMSLSKGTWNGANTGKLNATLTNGTTWTGDSSGAGSTIKLDASSWSGMNSGANADITLTNGASWSKGNTADGVTVKADKAAWTGANGGAKANITLSNSASWNGANTGSNATVNLTDSSWSGDNSGANVTITANNSKWNGSTSAAGSATLTNGSIWNGASTSADFALTLNGSTWNNSGASSLKSFTGTNGIVDMTNAAASVTIGSYSGDATVIYKHNSSNPGEVYGGNFTVNSAKNGSKINMLTDRSGVDFSDEDSIANALNSLANKLYYTGYITGERNLTGYVKLAEGLTASSVIKQTGDIAYDKTTGQGSLKDGSVTPNVTYPEEQTKDSFTSQITGEWKQDKEYKLAGVLHTDNAVYDFSKDRSIITTAGTSVGAGRDLQLQLNNKSMSLNSGADAVKADAITVEFKNLDKLDIKAAGQALLAENGGKIILHNTGAVTADSAFVANGAGSGIKADGLTNITVGSGDAVKADAGSIELAGGTVKGDVTADNKGKISINANNNAAGSILTDITGNVLATAGSSVDIGLGTADSKLTGDVSTAGDAVINIYADMGIWTGNADGDNVNLHLNSSKAQWNNIGNSKLRSLKGNGGIINQTDANAGNIDVGDYSGNVVVNYKHTAYKDTASNTLNNIKFGGGSLNIDKAAEGSSITLRTDNSDNLSYTETDNIEKLFRELSKKLYYADAGSNPNNLSGHVEIAEGLTKVKVYGDINYGEHGQGNYKDGSIKRTDPEIIYGSSETAMMRGAKSAMASTALLWRSENSDMLQRMGDVRLANEESGLWARYYGGKNSFDAKNTKYSTSFNAYQLGYDKQLDNNKLFGAAVSYNKGKNTYEMGGHGDGKAVSLAVYGSWNSDKGHYADVIVKGGKLDNDYTVYNDMGHKLEGDYDTWGLSLSAEYGRRMQMQNGFYIDPSVQFTVGRVAGADYSASSDFLDSKGLKKDMYVSQDAFTSAIGRIGLGMGKTTDKAMFYTKFALAHEFSGDFTTTFAAENEPTSSTAVDFGGTWFEWQMGGSMKVNDNSYVYATFEKKFGGDTGSNDWRLDAGLRWSF